MCSQAALTSKPQSPPLFPHPQPSNFIAALRYFHICWSAYSLQRSIISVQESPILIMLPFNTPQQDELLLAGKPTVVVEQIVPFRLFGLELEPPRPAATKIVLIPQAAETFNSSPQGGWVRIQRTTQGSRRFACRTVSTTDTELAWRSRNSRLLRLFIEVFSSPNWLLRITPLSHLYVIA